MSNRKWLSGITLSMVVLLGLLAFGTFDFEVSKRLINQNSGFAEFFNRFGEWPAIFGLLVGTAILFGGRSKSRMWQSVLNTIVAIPLMALFSTWLVLQPFHYVYEFTESGIPDARMPLIYGLAGLVFIATLWISQKLGRERLRSYRRVGLLLVALIFSEILVVNLLKVMWARPRMRSIEAYSQFRYWFEIQGPATTEEAKSFPSGHTANAFTLLAYTQFIPMERKRWLFYGTCFALTWGVCVALSRVILGAHFLSDVFVGGYITVIIFYGLSALMIRESDKSTSSVLKKTILRRGV